MQIQFADLPLDAGVQICQFLNFHSFFNLYVCSKSTRSWALQLDSLSDLDAFFLRKFFIYLNQLCPIHLYHVRGFMQLRRFHYDVWSISVPLTQRKVDVLLKVCRDALKHKTLRTISLIGPSREILEFFRSKDIFDEFVITDPKIPISLSEYSVTDLRIESHLIINNTNTNTENNIDGEIQDFLVLRTLALTEISDPQQLFWLTRCPNLQSVCLEFVPKFWVSRGRHQGLIPNPNWYTVPWEAFLQGRLKWPHLTDLQLALHHDFKMESQENQFLLEKLWNILQEACVSLKSLTICNPPLVTLDGISFRNKFNYCAHPLTHLTIEFSQWKSHSTTLVEWQHQLELKNRLLLLSYLQEIHLINMWGAYTDQILEEWICNPFVAVLFTRHPFHFTNLIKVKIESSLYLKYNGSDKLDRIISIAQKYKPSLAWDWI